MKSIEIRDKNIVATVDYRTELLGIIMWLSDYHRILPECFSVYENKFYIDNILNEFSKYKDEEIVNDFMSLVEKHKFNYDAPYALFLQLDEHFKCDKLDDYVFKERLEEDESVYDFIEKLEGFAKKINFEEYYSSNTAMYKKWTKTIFSYLKQSNILDFYDNYFGKIDNEFYINLIPFASDGAFSSSIGKKIYDMKPVYKNMKKESLYEAENCNMGLGEAVHEFLHGYVNPITERLGLLDFNTDLFDELKEDMSNNGYPTDVEIINEHIVRTIEIRYIDYLFKEANRTENTTKWEENQGFIYIRDILEKLEEFENNRETYKTFEDFYPEIIKCLKRNIKKKK